ncbi:hypothetical protein [Lactococcus fujiensis]|uniref:hypothetical protein n=1 Tax=Lactococcus fujiensis TaxID=610251 RepID=UPI0020923DBC|nr:hypothetical protein [Lactococcus fujiensis]
MVLFFSPEALSTISENQTNASGEKLGIGGLSDSLFVGRDLYRNSATDVGFRSIWKSFKPDCCSTNKWSRCGSNIQLRNSLSARYWR